MHLVLKLAWILFFTVSKQGPCFTAREKNGGDKRLVELEFANEFNEYIDEKNALASMCTYYHYQFSHSRYNSEEVLCFVAYKCISLLYCLHRSKSRSPVACF